MSTVTDLSKDQIREDVFTKEPPQYSPLHPKSMKHSSTSSTVRQPQSKSTFSVNCGRVFVAPHQIITQSTVQIKSYKSWSIFNILCCCLWLGCYAYYYSIVTNDLKERGDIRGALNASNKARKFNIISTVIGIIFIFITILIIIVRLYIESLI